MTALSCRETALMIARGELEEGSMLGRAAAWVHLLYCRYCRRYRRQLRVLALAARSLVPAGRESFEERLIGRLTA